MLSRVAELGGGEGASLSLSFSIHPKKTFFNFSCIDGDWLSGGSHRQRSGTALESSLTWGFELRLSDPRESDSSFALERLVSVVLLWFYLSEKFGSCEILKVNTEYSAHPTSLGNSVPIQIHSLNMGASGSKLEEDKALQLCRERKKFVKQALDGRCSLATAHIAYIQSLKSTGTALRKFVQPEAPLESSLYTSTSATATPEPLALAGKSLSHFSFSSPSASQRVDASEHLSLSPSPSSSARFHVNHMRFRGSFSKKVEEKLPVAVTGTITALSISQTITPQRAETTPPDTSPIAHETSPVAHETSPVAHEDSPWDYFGLFHPIDNHLSSHQGSEINDDFENYDAVKKLREAEEMPELEDEEDKVSSSHEDEESQDSEDEFDDPSTPETLVRSFENLNRATSYVPPSASPTMQTAGSTTPENELLNRDRSNSLRLSPLRAKSSETSTINEAKTNEAKMKVKEDGFEHKVAPKDFFLSMRDVENLFVNASNAGREVPKKLEANKMHFRPIIPGQGSGSASSMLFKACFSCGEDPSQVPEGPLQTTTKYLTWHRTTSSHSSSSRNLLGAHPLDYNEDVNVNPLESVYMDSGSHASTLDRLHAWERKLYDEVKASQIVRRQYDMKCKFLREQESRDESSHKVDKTRAAVKDLHSRIRVAIHRIHSVSKRIEELRDKELEPQLEELIEGLCRMWEVMHECHRLQLHIITIAYSNSHARISLHSESHRQSTSILENELHNLSSSFTKWMNAQKYYVQAINNWLHKCVSLPQTSTKRKRLRTAPDLKRSGPPIYTACGVWLEMLNSVPVKEVVDTVKGLERETSRFLPRQEKSHNSKKGGGEANEDDDGFEDWNMGCVQFRSSLTIFVSQLSGFAEHSMKMYGDLQKSIHEAKRNYEHLMAQP
ncbi:hypothetical protein V2J09_020730 [Rumex salicifolius]